MPIEPPPTIVTRDFLADINAAPVGTTLAPAAPRHAVAEPDGWKLTDTGLILPPNVLALLRGATANPDGSFTTAGGAIYWLSAQGGDAVVVPG